jgi:hypothetical protein
MMFFVWCEAPHFLAEPPGQRSWRAARRRLTSSPQLHSGRAVRRLHNSSGIYSSALTAGGNSNTESANGT